MRERQPPMTFEQIKVVEKAWGDVVKPEVTIASECRFLRGEVRELHQAIRKGDRGEVLGELADVMKVAMSMMHLLGADPEEVITNKIERNLHKYNMSEHERLVAEGLTHEQARERQKFAWDKKRDKEFE